MPTTLAHSTLSALAEAACQFPSHPIIIIRHVIINQSFLFCYFCFCFCLLVCLFLFLFLFACLFVFVSVCLLVYLFVVVVFNPLLVARPVLVDLQPVLTASSSLLCFLKHHPVLLL